MCEICTKSFAAFAAYYQSVTVANKNPFRHRHRRRHRRQFPLKESQIAQNPCAEFEEIAEICENYQPIHVAQTHPDDDDNDDISPQSIVNAATVATNPVRRNRNRRKSRNTP